MTRPMLETLKKSSADGYLKARATVSQKLEHARWSVIIPGLLNVWLKTKHIKTRFWNAAAARPELDGMDLIDWVVGAFAGLARSNDLLMGDNTHFKDIYAENTRKYILDCRYHYQLMCVWASWELATGRERRASSSQSVGSIESDQSYFTQVLHQRVQEHAESGNDTTEFDILLRSTLIRETPQVEPSQTRQRRGRLGLKLDHEKTSWLTDALRPNVHAGNHLLNFFEEYAGLANIDTLVGESEHKWFKLTVYQTNLKDCERVLLGVKVDMQLVCRLLVLGAFDDEYPALAEQIKRIWKICPTLFERILSRSDQRVAIDESELESEDFVADDETHFSTAVSGRLHRTVIARTLHAANENNLLPVSSQQMTTTFKRFIRAAYAEDYQIPNIYTLGRSVTKTKAPLEANSIALANPDAQSKLDSIFKSNLTGTFNLISNHAGAAKTAATSISQILSVNWAKNAQLSKTASGRKVRDGLINIQKSFRNDLKGPLDNLIKANKAVEDILIQLPLRKKRLEFSSGGVSYNRWINAQMPVPCKKEKTYSQTIGGFSASMPYEEVQACEFGPQKVSFIRTVIPYMKYRFV
ncbi:hypothetical protein FCIRC_8596 [Fusarium circinatum]|uniref:Uncharacterized protein n=1 Tax=Fusarium circinatum TaxID=48490 RepID=A0A8H5WTR7_FUSCI|nr:hypothetical protein FCIRC_8596 [Fusarium circinatum]